MYRLCLTSAVLLALGTGASFAQAISTPSPDPIAPIDSAASTALDSGSSADSASNPSAAPSPAVDNGTPPARATKRSARRHASAAAAKTVDSAPAATAEIVRTDSGEVARTDPDEITPAKTIEIKDTGERTVCEDVGLPGSRMIVGKRCRTYNINDRTDMKLAEEKREQTKQTMMELRRMQDNLEREQQQQEWNRERAIAALVVGGGH